MKVASDPDVHLTYCTNIHPGESWSEIRRNLETHVSGVRERVAHGRPFGVGLRVSARAARELAHPPALAELLEVLREAGLYVFTINGFPFGDFHATRVKEGVYRPDWLEPERSDYTNNLAVLLAALLPEGVDGSVSTVPVAHAPRMRDSADDERAAAMLIEHAAFLSRLRAETGRCIALALEPEPECRLETSADAVEFFERSLFARQAIHLFAAKTGLSPGPAEEALRRHLGVCFDTCHAAVEFEDPDEAVARIRSAGIRIAKIQLSAGLAVAPVHRHAVEALGAFADDVYLHQVVVRSRRGDRRYADLDRALADGVAEGDAEWRVHFHVPLFLQDLEMFRSTSRFVERILELQRSLVLTEHLEVETYTWDVLPHELRRHDVADAVARELDWVVGRLSP